MAYAKIVAPARGTRITVGEEGVLRVPGEPILPFIEGDGMGPARVVSERAIADKIVTYDFARQMPGAREVRTRELGRAIVERM